MKRKSKPLTEDEIKGVFIDITKRIDDVTLPF
jgi:hypothetical protein